MFEYECNYINFVSQNVYINRLTFGHSLGQKKQNKPLFLKTEGV